MYTPTDIQVRQLQQAQPMVELKKKLTQDTELNTKITISNKENNNIP